MNALPTARVVPTLVVVGGTRRRFGRAGRGDASTRASGSDGSDGGAGWVDLAGNAAGIGVRHEAARRRQAEGAGADRSWWVGADGEWAVAEVLRTLVEPPLLDRLRDGLLPRRQGRGRVWRVLHSVPVGTGAGDIDHVVIGPAGVVAINTKHHPRGRVIIDGDLITVNGRRTEYVARARREADRVNRLLASALIDAGHHELAELAVARSMLTVVGARLQVRSWPSGVTVTTPATLVVALRAMPVRLGPADVGQVFEIARRSTTWRRP